jgi:opacity protein-like surface antigen
MDPVRPSMVRYVFPAALVLVLAASAAGQGVGANKWRKGTTLAGFAGGATAPQPSAATGASFGWELLPHLTIDGSGIWTVPHHDGSTFSALLGVRANLTPPRPIVPFLSGGAGLQTASFDTSTSTIPEFYRRRVDDAAGFQRRFSFTDFAYAAGAGADIFLRPHVALRPDVRWVFVTGGGATHVTVVYGVHLAYHFEDHPITP